MWRSLLPASLALLCCVDCGGDAVETALGSGTSTATGAVDDSTGEGSDSGTPPSRPACAIKTPLRHDFESGFTNGWGAAFLGALQIDDVEPISGSKSLKVLVGSHLAGGGNAFVGKDVSPSCAVNLRLKLRASTLFESGQATVVHLETTPASLDLVLGENGAVSFVEQAASGQSEAHTVGSIAPGTAVAISIRIDLTTHTIEAALAPVGAALPAPTSSVLRLEHGDISEVTLGMWRATATTGTYSLDDFSLE